MSTDVKTPPAKPETQNGDGMSLEAFLTQGKSLVDESYFEDKAAVRAALTEATEILGRYTPAAKALSDIVLEGCQVCLKIRKLCLRGDNGDKDYWGVTKVYGDLWRTYTGTGTSAEAFRSAVATRMSNEQMVQTEIARDVVKAGLPKSAKVEGKHLDSALLETLISEAKPLPNVLSEKVDKVLARQVYTGNGKSKGLRVQGAEKTIASFGKRPKPAKGSKTGTTPDSAATGGNATTTAGVLAGQLSTMFGKVEGGLSKVEAAVLIHRLSTSLVDSLWGLPGEPSPDSDSSAVKGRKPALEVLAKAGHLLQVAHDLGDADTKLDKSALEPLRWSDKADKEGKTK
jgi:hypothetical protein